MYTRAFLFLMLVGLSLPASLRAEDQVIRVQVVAILVSDKHKNIDKRLEEFAKEVQKTKPELTGFKIGHSSGESIPIGKSKTFDLVDGKKVDVTINAKLDDNGKITLTIKPPDLTQITYSCKCDCFFSMATNHTTKDGEKLFLAIMAKPCTLKK